MAIIKCDYGHFYDNNRYGKCPYCEKAGTMFSTDIDVMMRSGKTVAAYDTSLPETNETVILKSDIQQPGSHIRVKHDTNDPRPSAIEEDPGKTVAIYGHSNGRKLICGWLVCTEGAERGQDYPIYTGYNRLGRGTDMDVCILGDPRISRKNHCSIVYEHMKNKFYLSPENGCITYLRGELLESAGEIQDGDYFSVGDSTFVLITFCRGERKWENG